MVKAENFTAMKGHVSHGQKILAPSGKVYELRNTIAGWNVNGPDGRPCSGNLTSAADVEFYVVNGLGSI